MDEHVFSPPSATTLGRDASPARLVVSLWRRRDLLRQLIARELAARHRASRLGWIWLILQPALSLGILTLVFSRILAIRWNQGSGHADYAVHALAGIVAFGFFSECANRAPLALVERSSLVKRLVFPVELLPVSLVGTSLVTAGIGLAMAVLLRTFLFGFPGWSLLFLPPVLVPLVALCLGTAWLLAGLGTLVRDVGPATGFATGLLFFVTPVTYPASMIPAEIAPVLRLNPLVPCLDGLRRVICDGAPPDWRSLGTATAAGLLCALAGHAVFARCRPHFADHL